MKNSEIDCLGLADKNNTWYFKGSVIESINMDWEVLWNGDIYSLITKGKKYPKQRMISPNVQSWAYFIHSEKTKGRLFVQQDIPWNRDITAEGKKHISTKESYPTKRQTK